MDIIGLNVMTIPLCVLYGSRALKRLILTFQNLTDFLFMFHRMMKDCIQLSKSTNPRLTSFSKM